MNSAVLIICYGVKVSKGDLYDLVVAKGTTDFYEAVYSAGLEYHITGHTTYSDEAVVGRSLSLNLTNELLELTYKEPSTYKFPIEHMFDEGAIKQDLTNFGITDEPKYLMFISYTD